eukprot:CAMPEP_0173393548 /NCGR_PEP_ID=MMETSP1356-20130122/22176_1 /TAXON_ID=77927 ORGANISM="Hemiselmis virescens, Strain PCC157" /NCGR_SAMPLE_ID=MMETSP1356 /ASSEMBLY_ACC=CAM_ASM_000847 /LENGTH=74 /DNA_ID=CAMNT_0014351587 /DNA_START=168 /DNA_END=389 /DNA_ORIENTATION=+
MIRADHMAEKPVGFARESSLSLSRGGSFDGVTCRCGRGCSTNLSNYAFAMEVQDSIDVDKCFGKRSDDRSLVTV